MAYTSGSARRFDASALEGFVDLPRGRGTPLAHAVTRLGDPVPVALAALSLSIVALVRGRPRVAVAVPLLVGATSVSGQLLKALLSYPREAGGEVVGPEAFPSGHSTAAMTLALCLVLVAPGRLRPLAAALGLALALAVAFAVISLRWHFPSDVIGGFLLATCWALAAVSGLLWLEERRPRRLGRPAALVDRVAAVGLVSAIVACGVLLVVGAAALIATAPDVAGFVERHTAAVVVAPGIVVAAAALLAGVTAALRRRQD